MKLEHLHEAEEKDHEKEERDYFKIGVDCLNGLIDYVEKEDNDAEDWRKEDYKKIAKQSRVLRDLMKKHCKGYKQEVTEGKKPKPTNPELWQRAIAAAKRKYDVYPSAYANSYAAKWYKEKGGGWK